MIHAFIFGIILAFGLIIPLGMQNIFLFNQGATQKYLIKAAPAVITAFICDALLVCSAVLGISIIIFKVSWLETFILAAGLLFLLYMGWVIWQTESPGLQGELQALSPKKQIAYAASVSLLNPHAIIDSMAVIGANSMRFDGKEKIAFTLACILVSFCWFSGLAIAGHYIHRADRSGRVLLLLNKFSALIIWTVAVVIALELYKQLGKIFFHYQL